MIIKLRLLHYLSESTYHRIANIVRLKTSNIAIGDNYVEYPDSAITKIHMFSIEYNQLGRIWFLYTHVDYRKLACEYSEFADVLYAQYQLLFGQEVMSEFPAYNGINCDFIQYACIAKVDDADRCLAVLAESSCVPAQLDRAMWPQFEKPHGTISFYAAKHDATHLIVMAKCYGTALKKRIKEQSRHIATGVIPSAVVDHSEELKILSWLIEKQTNKMAFNYEWVDDAALPDDI